MKKHVTLSLEFAGIDLPVAQNEQGQDVVPLKPISDLFGLEWQRQYKKMQTPEFTRRMGACVVQMYYAGQRRDVTCIRIDKVVSFLNRINADKIRNAGNIDGADFLEAKQDEWDEVLDEYSIQKGMMTGREDKQSVNRSRALKDYLSLQRAKKHATEDDLKVIESLLRDQAAILGRPYESVQIH